MVMLICGLSTLDTPYIIPPTSWVKEYPSFIQFPNHKLGVLNFNSLVNSSFDNQN